MDIIQHLKKSVVQKATRYGLVLTPEALDYLTFSVRDVDAVLRSLSRKGITFVRLEDLTDEPFPAPQPIQEASELPVETSNCEPRFRVRLYVDPDDLEPTNWERERREILLHRLEFLGEVLRSRGVSVVDYNRALRSSEERVVVGVVLSMDITSTGKRLLRLENEESSVDVLVPEEKELMRKLSHVDLDSVVGARVVSRNDRLILRDLHFPGSVAYHSPCDLRILVVPHPWRNGIPLVDADAVVLLSNIVNVYQVMDIKKAYRDVDEQLVSMDVPVFVVPGPLDATRLVPPRPPLEENLFPQSSASDHVHLLGSPAVLRINGIDLVLQDEWYHARSGLPPSSVFKLLLIQPNISSVPYRSTRDYSLLKRPPHYVLIPVGLSNHRAVGLDVPYLLDLSQGKVMPVEEGRG